MSRAASSLGRTLALFPVRPQAVSFCVKAAENHAEQSVVKLPCSCRLRALVSSWVDCGCGQFLHLLKGDGARTYLGGQ